MTVRAVVLREFARLAKDRRAAHVTLPGLISVNCMSTDGGSVMGRLVAGMEHVNRRSAAQVSWTTFASTQQLSIQGHDCG